MKSDPLQAWEFWIDVGGTFTDCLARRPDGSLATAKVLSSGTVQTRVVDRRGSTLRVAGIEGGARGSLVGYQCRSLDSGGGKLSTSSVEANAGDRLRLAETPGEEAVGLLLDGGEPSPLLAIRKVMEVGRDVDLGGVRVRLGTTLGTNALLERRGARTALLINEGLTDLLTIGNQDRPNLFDLRVRRPPPLTGDVVGLRGRIGADGGIAEELDGNQLDAVIEELRRRKVQSVAVCMMHAYSNDAQEVEIERRLRAAGFGEVSRSSEVSPTQRIVPRCDTTVLDAYLTPVIREASEDLSGRLPGSKIRWMTSSRRPGRSLQVSRSATRFAAVPRVASSPCRRSLDNWATWKAWSDSTWCGTSTDVSRWAGALAFETETRKAEVRLATPCWRSRRWP